MKQPTVIDTIVKYSKDCIVMRFILQHYVTSVRLIKSLPQRYIIPDVDKLEEYAISLALHIDEKEDDIGKLLIPLIDGETYYYKNSKYSITIEDIRNGYTKLGGETRILFLRPLRGHLSNFEYLSGVVYPITDILSKELSKMPRIKLNVISQDIMTLIINNKKKYEYIK